MIDRFGKAVFVGWPAHQILWIEAAMTLPHQERMAAFEDIAAMTTRTFMAVYNKAAHIKRDREAQERRQRLAAQSKAYQNGSADQRVR